MGFLVILYVAGFLGMLGLHAYGARFCGVNEDDSAEKLVIIAVIFSLTWPLTLVLMLLDLGSNDDGDECDDCREGRH